MNRANIRGEERYHHEEIAYESYADHYEVPYRMQVHQQIVQKEKESGKPQKMRQMVSNSPMNRIPLPHFKIGHSDVAIDEDEGDEDEDIYVEINEDDEDAEYETGVVNDPIRSYYRPTDAIDRSSIKPSFRCLACGRCYTEKFRLFRWPREEQVRRTWSHILGLEFEKVRSSLASSFLCAFHFNARDFVCSSDFVQILWATHAKPKRYTDPTELFPWEKVRPRVSSVHSKNDVIINFRPSKYKVNAAKNTHAVAVVSSLSNPHIQYEFSWNRTSSVDGTKFYSCLHCRKANKDSGGKDIVRTIHLNGKKLLSGQDPLEGHHHACTPIDRTPTREEMEGAERMERFPREHPMDNHKKQQGLVSGGMEGGVKLSAHGRIVYVDESSAFSNGRVVEVEATEEEWSTTEEDQTAGTIHTLDGQHSNSDDLLLRDATSSDHWIDYNKMENMRGWKDEEEERRDTRRIRHKLLKKYRGRRHGPRLVSLACPLCTHRSPSTCKLIVHLEEHVRNGGECAVCAERIDPALPPSIRRSGTCSMCKFESG
ncbi:hypothetical protein PMAYCL1PPCAC_12681 [Pristionchus mayeri]|uniref:THAP-type domain-containing protein n=1 Tax=Pristionchus mayeri TaxID=1317129 RepID=A0AAN5CH13_9BILA|nr:hypothetical protein PMAYCL1PPCAC_12681 [Pristionchus mayeri]